MHLWIYEFVPSSLCFFFTSCFTTETFETCTKAWLSTAKDFLRVSFPCCTGAYRPACITLPVFFFFLGLFPFSTFLFFGVKVVYYSVCLCKTQPFFRIWSLGNPCHHCCRPTVFPFVYITTVLNSWHWMMLDKEWVSIGIRIAWNVILNSNVLLNTNYNYA